MASGLMCSSTQFCTLRNEVFEIQGDARNKIGDHENPKFSLPGYNLDQIEVDVEAMGQVVHTHVRENMEVETCKMKPSSSGTRIYFNMHLMRTSRAYGLIYFYRCNKCLFS